MDSKPPACGQDIVDQHIPIEDRVTKCSNYAHDKALMGEVAFPEPDELLADIMALENWRAQTEKRSADTAKKRKAGTPTIAVPSMATA